MAVLKGRKQSFVIGGAVGLSYYLDRLLDGELEVLIPSPDAPGCQEALETAGFLVERTEGEDEARIVYGEHAVMLRWGLPTPLRGHLDEAWFTACARGRILDLRVKIAPLEEIIWLRIAAAGGASLADSHVQEAMIHTEQRLDWRRLLLRMAGLEALLLSHIFLLYHRQPESARLAFPKKVLSVLMDQVAWRMNAAASSTVEHHAP